TTYDNAIIIYNNIKLQTKVSKALHCAKVSGRLNVLVTSSIINRVLEKFHLKKAATSHVPETSLQEHPSLNKQSKVSTSVYCHGMGKCFKKSAASVEAYPPGRAQSFAGTPDKW
ncbi:2938_t:CDS:2, partial [Paraglomus brasilianum]